MIGYTIHRVENPILKRITGKRSEDIFFHLEEYPYFMYHLL